MGYSFQLAARDLLFVPSHIQDINTIVSVTPVVEHWLEQTINGSTKRDQIRQHMTSQANTLPLG